MTTFNTLARRTVVVEVPAWVKFRVRMRKADDQYVPYINVLYGWQQAIQVVG